MAGSRLQALFDNGVAGDTITTANSGVTTASALGGNTAILATAAAWHGGLGGLFTTVTGGNTAGAFFTLNYDGDDNQQTFSGVLLTPASNPSTDMTVVSWRDAANGTIMRLFIRASDGGIYMTDSGAAYVQLAADADYNPNTKYRVTVTATVGTTTGNGSYTAKIRRQADQVQIGTTATSSTANLGTAAFHRIVAGIVGSNLGYSIGWDDIQLQSGTTTELGDWAPPVNQFPIVNAGVDQSTPVGINLTRTATATDPDGTIATQQWTCTTKPGAVSVTPTFPAGASFTYNYPQPGTYVFQFAATDNDGATTPDSITVTAVAGTAPTVSVNQTLAPGIIDARASTASAGGTLSYAISPAGPVQITPGCWYAAAGVADVTYTVTVTESGSGASASAATTVAALSGGGAYPGGPVTLALPTPNDPSTDDAWGTLLNAEVSKLANKLNDIIGFIA